MEELHRKLLAIGYAATHRDYIDIHAASKQLGRQALESFCARHTPGFSLEDLADRLGAFGERSFTGFAKYGLEENDVQVLARWAVEWETDIRLRLAAGERGPAGAGGEEWDEYLESS